MPVIGRGSLEGATGHVASGGFEIVETSRNRRLCLAADFEFDGAPAPWWGFGRNGGFVEGTLFAALRSNVGAQSYPIPGSLDVGRFDTLVLWCRTADVLLAFGSITNN